MGDEWYISDANHARLCVCCQYIEWWEEGPEVGPNSGCSDTSDVKDMPIEECWTTTYDSEDQITQQAVCPEVFEKPHFFGVIKLTEAAALAVIFPVLAVFTFWLSLKRADTLKGIYMERVKAEIAEAKERALAMSKEAESEE